ncbi:MAG: host attachment protein [Rhodobacter sp.]|nr:host attachment protein [Rhodobacter sp.]
MKKDASRVWALAINSTQARIVRGLGTGENAAPAELVLKTSAKKPRDIMSDKPGRSFASKGGGRRSAMEYSSDPVTEVHRDFIRQVIQLLESHRRAAEFDQLAIFAEHDMLGLLRPMLPQPLSALVIKEVPKNFLHLSEHELPKAILHELADGPRIS